MSKKSTTKQVTLVMIITMVSKCLGFLRDVILARFFGANSVTDAYFVSQTIPEFLFMLVVQAISIGFIPIYIDVSHNKSRLDADEFTDNVTKISLILACVLIVFVNLLPSQIVSLFATGFDADTMKLAISFVRITVLAMVFRITVAVYNAFLHANDHFIITSFNGIVFDLAIIMSIIIAYFTNNVFLAWGVVIGAFVQFVLLTPSVIKSKNKFIFSNKNIFGEDIKKLIKVALPVVIGIAAHQINVLVDKTMASSIVGGISCLNYANRIDNVLENVIIMSLATVIFPKFSKYAVADDKTNLQKSVVKSLDVATITMLPCMAFCLLFSEEIVRVLLASGAFDTVAVENTSIAMNYYSVGIIFVAYVAILNRCFYSLKKTVFTSLVTCCVVITNVLMNLLLKPILGIGGLALATSISNMIGSLVLFITLRKELKMSVFTGTLKETWKSIVACLFLAASAFGTYRLLVSYMHYVFALIISVIVGSVLYIVTELVLKSEVILSAFKKLKFRK